MSSPSADDTMDLASLSKRSGVSQRKIRFWIQRGLVPSPVGKGRAARYGHEHLERLQLIQGLRDESNLPLDVIRDVLQGFDVVVAADESSTEHGEADAGGHQMAGENESSEATPHGLKGVNISAALDYATRARSAASSVARAPRQLVGSYLSTFSRGGKRVSEERPQPSYWERIPLTEDIEIHVRVPRRGAGNGLLRPLAGESSDAGDAVLSGALSVLEAHPEGVRLEDLLRELSADDPELDPAAIPYMVWRLVEEETAVAYDSTDGLLRLVVPGVVGGESESRRDESVSVGEQEGPAGDSRHSTVYSLVHAELLRLAKLRTTTQYPSIAKVMGITPHGIYMGSQAGLILNEICEDEVALGHPMLSAVVVGYKGEPGAGFYETARQLGRLAAGVDEKEFWKAELEAVYEMWGTSGPTT